MSKEQKRIAHYCRRVRVRMGFTRGMAGAMRACFYASLVLLVAVLGHRLIGVETPVVWTAGVVVAGIFLVGLVTALLPRIGLLEAAVAADERAGWKERLSSALAMDSVSRPMEAALVEDADDRVRRRNPADLFPMVCPRELRTVPLVATFIAAFAFLCPDLDLLGYRAEAREEERDRKEIEVALEKLERRKKDLRKTNKEPSDREKAINEKIDALMKALQKTPPKDKKQALAQISSLADELQKLKNEMGRAQAMAQKVQKAMSKEGPDAGKLGQMLKAGRFKEAVEALAAMRRALRQGNMTPEQRERLERQLQALKDRIGKDRDLSEIEKQLAKAMQGLRQGDPRAMEGLEDALGDLDADFSDSESLADALRDLQQLADAMSQGQHECPSCGTKGKGPGCKGPDGKGCPGGLGHGSGQSWNWGDGDGQGQGGAFGNRGQGKGGVAPETPEDVALKRSKARSQMGKGRYVGLYFMKGEPPKGTAATEYAEVQRVFAEEAMDALENQKVPAAQRDYVRDYFDAIRLGGNDEK